MEHLLVFILNLLKQKLTEMHTGTQQMIHFDRTEHCY